MIVKQIEDYLELIKQHDHAEFSYHIARYWNPAYFSYPERKEEVLYTIRNHDRAWISLDINLRWNKNKNEPFHFNDYPLSEKLQAYAKGIQEIEEETKYGAILSSLHYTSFFKDKQSEQIKEIKRFKQKEEERRKRLLTSVQQNENMSMVSRHLQLLQFCDDLSLYVCMNKRGVKKQEEFAWFKEGFRQRFSFAPKGLMANWKDEEHVQVIPFPFTESFTATLPVYQLEKNTLSPESSWDQLNKQQITITFIP